MVYAAGTRNDAWAFERSVHKPVAYHPWLVPGRLYLWLGGPNYKVCG